MIRHPALAVAIALVLALGSILSGAAMALHAGSEVELCVDGGTITVTLDDQGRPAAPHRPCPVCLAAQDMDLPPAPTTWSAPGTVARIVALDADPAAPHARVARHVARGPPPPV